MGIAEELEALCADELTVRVRGELPDDDVVNASIERMLSKDRNSQNT